MVARIESNAPHRTDDCEACEKLFGTKDDHRKAHEGFWIPFGFMGLIIGLLLSGLIWGAK